MKNAVGREIPDYLLKDGKEVYQGKNYMDGKYLQKASPRTRRCEKPVDTKVVSSLAEALKQCGARDGMTFSFHHHLRDGDYVVNLVMAAAIEELGLKDLTIAATSLGSAHDPIAAYIEEGKVVGIQTSGIRGKMGEVVSAGKLKTPAIIRSHGGRPRAIEGGRGPHRHRLRGRPHQRPNGQLPGRGGQERLRLPGLRHDRRQVRRPRGGGHRLPGGLPQLPGLGGGHRCGRGGGSGLHR